MLVVSNIKKIRADGHSAPWNKQRKTAFTLAEVLVTLGIIGVVSAMTIPTLMSNHQRKVYVTRLNKVYSEIQQAAINFMNNKNAVNLVEAGINSTANANKLITDNFNIVETCSNSLSPCFADSYKLLSGSNYDLSSHVSTSYVLASGESIRLLYSKADDKIVNILVDINGKQGPNILGRDAFYMALYNNGVIDTYNNSATSAPLTEEQRESAGSEWGPFGQLLNDNWEMTY